jgi:glycosyltransferase involved in cell wall biosynthesis
MASSPSSQHVERREECLDAPACTVVMAAYNAAPTITDSIASVLAQTWRDFELVVVDDGSTDDTAERVSQWGGDPRVRLHRQENAGPATARNSGIGLARGRYIAILDSDDLWLPAYLETMIGALQEAPTAAFAFTRSWVLERRSNRILKDTWPVRLPSFPVDEGDALLRALVIGNFVNSSVTVRREVIEHVGGYDPWVSVSEDFELWLRIAASGYGATPVPRPLVIRSDRADSLSKNEVEMCAGKKRAFQRLLDRSDLDAEVQALARRAVVQLERGMQLLSGQRRPTAAEHVRKLGGRATRPIRRRTRHRATPPSDVARWFPALGTGTRGTFAARLPRSVRSHSFPVERERAFR